MAVPGQLTNGDITSNPDLACLRSCSNVKGVKGQTANALQRDMFVGVA